MNRNEAFVSRSYSGASSTSGVKETGAQFWVCTPGSKVALKTGHGLYEHLLCLLRLVKKCRCKHPGQAADTSAVGAGGLGAGVDKQARGPS